MLPNALADRSYSCIRHEIESLERSIRKIRSAPMDADAKRAVMCCEQLIGVLERELIRRRTR